MLFRKPAQTTTVSLSANAVLSAMGGSKPCSPRISEYVWQLSQIDPYNLDMSDGFTIRIFEQFRSETIANSHNWLSPSDQTRNRDKYGNALPLFNRTNFVYWIEDEIEYYRAHFTVIAPNRMPMSGLETIPSTVSKAGYPENPLN
jgi:hypothetical protein